VALDGPCKKFLYSQPVENEGSASDKSEVWKCERDREGVDEEAGIFIVPRQVAAAWLQDMAGKVCGEASKWKRHALLPIRSSVCIAVDLVDAGAVGPSHRCESLPADLAHMRDPAKKGRKKHQEKKAPGGACEAQRDLQIAV
jgi:hypothetical protein